MDKPVVKQAHGLTPEEMADLRVHQMNDTVPMIPANNAAEDQIKDPYFKAKYKDHMIPEVERNHYHVVTEARLFKAQGSVPEKLSEDVLHVFTKEAFKFQMEHEAFKGMDVHILHNPTLNTAEKGVLVKGSDQDDEDEEDDQYAELSKLTVPELKEKYLKLTGEDMPAVKNKKEAILQVQEAMTA